MAGETISAEDYYNNKLQKALKQYREACEQLDDSVEQLESKKQEWAIHKGDKSYRTDEVNIDELINALDQFAEAIKIYGNSRKNLRYLFIDPSFSLLHNLGPDERDCLRMILSGKRTHHDQLVYDFLDKLNDDESQGWDVDAMLGFSVDKMGADIWALVEEYFNPWFNYTDFIENMFETGNLIIDHPQLPSFLETYLIEARLSYAFENHLACIAMLRAVMEICFHHLTQVQFEPGEGEPPRETVFRSERNSFRRNADALLEKEPELKRRAHALYSRMNYVIHGNIFRDGVPKAKDTLDIYRQVLELIDHCYSQM